MNLPTNTPNLVEYVAGSGADVMWAEGHPTTQFPQHVFGLERLPYTADQWSAIDWSVRAGAFLSLLAGLLVVATFIRWRPFRTPANRLIVFIAVCDLVGAAAMAMGRYITSGLVLTCFYLTSILRGMSSFIIRH